mmetsp:Transcript_97193/g.280481  ORF Transcript_97193/g.280481 Transcript_97193/m.280481 type:complete len:456 (-) Transcript_97193:1371-2738(-)
MSSTPIRPHDDDADLSEHTLSMRQAARYCVECLTAISWSPAWKCGNIDFQERQDCRRQAYENFWSKSDPKTPELCHSEIPSAQDFRKEFHELNLPCLITFDDSDGYFRFITTEWRRSTGTDAAADEDGLTSIHSDWFLETLGPSAKVPVRFQPTCKDDAILDDEGRAAECETKEFTMAEWVDMLRNYPDGIDASPFYLKDWHLILQLKETKGASKSKPLYECPAIFEYDILNPFLTRFTNGDYRFCYWGPRGSFTSRHSDVLHSFSWSYNVSGTKQWTFYRDSPSGTKSQSFQVIQRTGQAMFVPSLWQHEVINLEETISVNHNWVTFANLDLCWDCLQTEMEAIDKELLDWGIEADNLEARESMLRGCVGLDVSAFVLMSLHRICSLLSTADSSRDFAMEEQSELSCLVAMLQTIRRDDSVHLHSRLSGVLQSSSTAEDLASSVDLLVDRLLPS